MTVYSETFIHGTPGYQLAIVDGADGARAMGRIEGERVGIGDTVVEAETRDGVRYFHKG